MTITVKLDNHNISPDPLSINLEPKQFSDIIFDNLQFAGILNKDLFTNADGTIFHNGTLRNTSDERIPATLEPILHLCFVSPPARKYNKDFHTNAEITISYKCEKKIFLKIKLRHLREFVMQF